MSRFRFRIVTVLATATAGSACTQTPPLPDPRVVEEELMEADREFSRQTTRRGVDGWVEAFAPHGKLFGPGPILEGHDAIRQAMAGIGEEGNTLVWEPVYAEAGPAGDFGYTHGTYRRERTDPDGNVQVETGKYVSVWRRDETGRFRVVIDTGHPDPPPRLPAE